MTLKELYNRENAKRRQLPPTPGQTFITEIARITKKSEIAVRRWLSDSKTSCVPDALTQTVLAEHFNTTPEELFPTNAGNN